MACVLIEFDTSALQYLLYILTTGRGSYNYCMPLVEPKANHKFRPINRRFRARKGTSEESYSPSSVSRLEETCSPRVRSIVTFGREGCERRAWHLMLFNII